MRGVQISRVGPVCPYSHTRGSFRTRRLVLVSEVAEVMFLAGGGYLLQKRRSMSWAGQPPVAIPQNKLSRATRSEKTLHFSIPPSPEAMETRPNMGHADMVGNHLDFEYTAYAVRTAARVVRPGRMDMTKLGKGRRIGGGLAKPDKGYHMFERWTGSSSILRDTELEPAHMAPSATNHPVEKGGAREAGDDRRMREIFSMSAGPEWTSEPPRSTHAEKGSPLGAHEHSKNAAPSSLDPVRVSRKGMETDRVSLPPSPGQRHTPGSATQPWRAASTDRPMNMQERPGTSSSTYADARVEQQARDSEEDEVWPGLALSGSGAGPSSPLGGSGPEGKSSSRQWRLIGGCRALGITPGRAASVPPLAAALVASEPRDVRRCVRALRRCLGGIPFKRAASIVCSEPRLIKVSETDMTNQVSYIVCGYTS